MPLYINKPYWLRQTGFRHVRLLLEKADDENQIFDILPLANTNEITHIHNFKKIITEIYAG